MNNFWHMNVKPSFGIDYAELALRSRATERLKMR